MSLISQASRQKQIEIHKRSRSTPIVLKRGGVALPEQLFHVRKVSQVAVTEGEAVSVGGGDIELSGDLEADVAQDDTFSYDGKMWVITDAPLIGTDSVARRAIAEMRL
jgi:hypothetical protein